MQATASFHWQKTLLIQSEKEKGKGTGSSETARGVIGLQLHRVEGKFKYI